MQKIVLLGKSQQQNANPQSTPKYICQNCLKLQNQLTELNNFINQRDEQMQSAISISQNEIIKQIQSELFDVREKYVALKKKVKLIEKENDELFMENTIIDKQLISCRAQLKQYGDQTKVITKQYDNMVEEKDRDHLKQNSIRQESQSKEIKELKVELYVEREKVSKLQILIKIQSDQLVKLRQYLRKRNRQQSDRHRIIQQILA